MEKLQGSWLVHEGDLDLPTDVLARKQRVLPPAFLDPESTRNFVSLRVEAARPLLLAIVTDLRSPGEIHGQHERGQPARPRFDHQHLELGKALERARANHCGNEALWNHRQVDPRAG